MLDSTGLFRIHVNVDIFTSLKITIEKAWLTYVPLQYNFRMRALSGELPGVKKASW